MTCGRSPGNVFQRAPEFNADESQVKVCYGKLCVAFMVEEELVASYANEGWSFDKNVGTKNVQISTPFFLIPW